MQPKRIKTMKQTTVRERWSEAVAEVARGRELIAIERAGILVAALVSAQELAWIQARYAALAELGQVMGELGAAFADLPEPERLSRIEQTVDTTRRERRARR